MHEAIYLNEKSYHLRYKNYHCGMGAEQKELGRHVHQEARRNRVDCAKNAYRDGELEGMATRSRGSVEPGGQVTKVDDLVVSENFLMYARSISYQPTSLHPHSNNKKSYPLPFLHIGMVKESILNAPKE